MRLGWLRPVHCKSPAAQETRALLTARKDKRARLIMSAPGAGVIMALTYVSAIDSP